MKVLRSMVLVSADDASLERGAQDVFRAFLEEIDDVGLSNQVAVTTIRDAGIQAATPLVIVYPDAAVYGPVTTVSEVHEIVEEHLVKGSIVSHLLAMFHGAAPEIEWTRGRRGALRAGSGFWMIQISSLGWKLASSTGPVTAGAPLADTTFSPSPDPSLIRPW